MKSIIVLVGILTFFSFSKSPLIDLHQKFQSDQLLVVTTDNWNTIHGKLNTYEWINGKWKLKIKNIDVVVGRKGLSWGKGLQDEQLMTGDTKREGDGKSPAGIFPLTGLFGYGDLKEKMSYIKADKSTFCVDDTSSVYYGKIVDADTIQKDWKSAETMRLKSDNYKYGIFVGYNTGNVQPGKGSCIFIHIWSGINSPTSGCTAMTENNILKLFRFLNKQKNPLLIQLPADEYQRFRSVYKLPRI